MVWYGMILYVLWEGVGTIKWPPGQRRPASDVVCQPAKVRPKHKSANLVGLELSTLQLNGEGGRDSKFEMILTYFHEYKITWDIS